MNDIDEQIVQLETSTSEALALLAGLLAEAAGAVKLAAHFAFAMDALRQLNPNPQRERLLRNAYRVVLLKARDLDPGNKALQNLCASELGTRQGH